MATEIKYEAVIEQARNLGVRDQLRLISDLSAILSRELHFTGQDRKTSADFYGAMRGVKYEESDFEAAEWHPTL
jgi:hypothetical protein